MANAGRQRRYSWKRVALHAAIALALAAAAAGVAAAALDVDDPARMVADTARLLLPGLLLAGFCSYLVQTRRRAYAAVFGLLAAAMLTGAVAMPIVRHTAARRVRLTDAERAPLEPVDIGGVPHLRHPQLSFSFALPPGLEHSVDTEITLRAQLHDDPGRRVYAYAGADPKHAMLVVVIEKWNRVGRAQVARIVDELARVGGSSAERERRIIWEPSFRGAEAHYVVGDRDHLRIGAWVDSFGADDGELIVAIVGYSRGDDELAGVVPSFRYR